MQVEVAGGVAGQGEGDGAEPAAGGAEDQEGRAELFGPPGEGAGDGAVQDLDAGRGQVEGGEALGQVSVDPFAQRQLAFVFVVQEEGAVGLVALGEAQQGVRLDDVEHAQGALPSPAQVLGAAHQAFEGVVEIHGDDEGGEWVHVRTTVAAMGG